MGLTNSYMHSDPSPATFHTTSVQSRVGERGLPVRNAGTKRALDAAWRCSPRRRGRHDRSVLVLDGGTISRLSSRSRSESNIDRPR